MRPPTHVLLRDIERSIERSVESPMLEDMNAHELRACVYDLVTAYQKELADPAIYLERLAGIACEHREKIGEARGRSVAAREAVLRRLLDIVQPAMAALLGPVPAETWNLPGQHGQRLDHAFLRGFELVDGKRKSPAGPGRFTISGKSWWIVALPPENGEPVNPRYVCLEHSGSVDDHREGQGHALCDPQLVTVAEAAEQIRDDAFQELIAVVVRRLRKLAADKQNDIAADADARASQLYAGLRAMNRYDTDKDRT